MKHQALHPVGGASQELLPRTPGHDNGVVVDRGYVGQEDLLPRLRKGYAPRASRNLRIGPFCLWLVDQVPIRRLRRYHVSLATVGLHHGTESQLITPSLVTGHVPQIGLELFSALKEDAEEVFMLLHVGDSCLSGNRVVCLLSEQVEGEGPKLAIAIALHLLHPHAECFEASVQTVPIAVTSLSHIPDSLEEILPDVRVQRRHPATKPLQRTAASVALEGNRAARLTQQTLSSSLGLLALIQHFILR
mmetsp:Transcript_75959/g.176199  ORF Transcript_75959/g.176199 Transcript_75959/m.176199 type:complete len:247 (-) Transcript_75959:238-978(-)|eukprot:CAMPEP_0171072504 /NCGR_PEP_ID=MMETSP0766_2-20121228/10900_1 /TAXON_ID=439317 /ORGANISM="Gambierdiscus australes, Strain CAWD 149" /LENGTH=246 /DNA_ID=CAMNT_0011529095 /DNA_START=48 /DNA_END=788 /DNA_ORIENTATION=+